MNVLVTGGAGYIGSHTCVELLNAGHRVLVIDNLCRSNPEALNRVRQITGKELQFRRIDLLDYEPLLAASREFSPDAVVHFAALKAVGESVSIPLTYYENNLTGTLNLCRAMSAVNCKNLVFSSSCTVYGNPARVPVTEASPTQNAECPYGRTKLFIEEILRDAAAADAAWHIALLRYFNPVGAHASGLLGEDPRGTPNNLLPYIALVAAGKLPELSVFGNDYPTPDGTCVRDYLHVVDLAKGHLAALDGLPRFAGARAWNFGTGAGVSVLEVIAAFASASGQKIPYKIAPRRAGDVVATYADPTRAREELHWQAELSLAQMCADVWRWQTQNPDGYQTRK
ncbi:UDP-glucose 4-epimerase [Planctomycetales bacterium]|nr:UDP-glucose 4-epimerase [Planctomycetales bacterium]